MFPTEIEKDQWHEIGYDRSLNVNLEYIQHNFQQINCVYHACAYWQD